MTKTAINTRTQEEYDALMEWRKQTGQPYLGNGIWQKYQEDTCIDFDNGNWPAFSGIEWYEKQGYTIIPYTEFAKANIVKEKPKSRLFDPKAQQPIPSEDCPEFSVDVFIIDEKEMHGLACYHFEDKKWIFHTDTLVDYNEKGAETQWRWYYPDVQWGEESAEIDYKALYLEGREFLERVCDAYTPETNEQDELEHKIKQFLTNHKDGEYRNQIGV